jgi:hypothetical protein
MITINMNKIKRFFKIQVNTVGLNKTYLMVTGIIIKYLLKKPIRNDFLQNLQLITFFDAGAAWTGKNPYDDENLFNQTTLDQQPVSVTVRNNREPIVYGYGFGIRSRLLGYFVRADWAWGVDDGQVLDRVFYLSLNMDF